MAHAAIRIRSGAVAEISTGGGEPASPVGDPCTLDAAGRVVTAGLWNSHVHHTDPAFRSEDSAAPLEAEMFLSRGFTTVVDTGADPRVIQALRELIASGRIHGPRILAAGGGFVYRDGTPSYLPKGLLPELDDPAQAAAAVQSVLEGPADAIKIFSGSFQTPTHTIHLPSEIIKAITDAAHARGALVFSHPQDREGFVSAVDNGVDVLAHTAPPAGKLEPELLERMRSRNVALIPTLMLWRWELERHKVPPFVVQKYIEDGVGQLRDYHAVGGEVLFGTDVGYMTAYDPSEEYELMARAGLDFRQILKSLTTAPAARFAGTDGQRFVPGTVAVGAPGDLVVLDVDPAQDATAFARPAMTIRGGQLVYSRR